MEGFHRHARDQWLRAAQSIPLNIAEGNGKRSLKDRARFLDIARGSALECAAIQDVLVVSDGLNRETSFELKSKLVRIVAMLTRMAMKFDGVSEFLSAYTLGDDYAHEHRDAEQHIVLNLPRSRARIFMGTSLFRVWGGTNVGSSRNLVGASGWCEVEFPAVEQDANTVVLELAKASGC